MLALRVLLDWRGCWFQSWEGVVLAEWHAGKAARVRLMMSPLGSGEEKIMSHIEVSVPT